jgi:S1-C subfamily serine protease
MLLRTIMMRVVPKGGLVLLCAAVMAQTPGVQTPAPPRRPTTQVRVDPRAAQRRPAPQVVTIVHRLNGLKMFRLLLRSEQQAQAIAGLGSTFNLLDDVHTNVIAGVAMDDGQTIAAWLPEANLEFAPQFPNPFADAKISETSTAQFKYRFADPPDVSVIGPDGKPLAARYVGFDATTGLSILRLKEKNLFPAATMRDEPLDPGENVLLFGPEPVLKDQPLASNNLYVRIASIEGRIENVLPAPSGEVARFKVRAPRLSDVNIGGVAVNEAGQTIGIVDGLEGNEATILPAASIRRAAQRVLERRSSVPRPWLGVKGEAVAALKFEQIVNQGWTMDRAADLAGKHRGIMLTSVLPDSPASRAELRAGDVILKVDDKEIQNADDFTWWLEQAGASSSVRFTVARPDSPAEEALNVKLSALLDPAAGYGFRNRIPLNKGFSLLEQGIETIAVGPVVASQLGTTAGLLVVYVEPSSPAFEAGLKPGDVIQSIDGKPVSALSRAVPLKSVSTLDVVRSKEKLTITLAKPAKTK